MILVYTVVYRIRCGIKIYLLYAKYAKSVWSTRRYGALGAKKTRPGW